MHRIDDDIRRYQGRLTPTPPRKAIYATRCAARVTKLGVNHGGYEAYCEAPTVNGDQWCYAHKDEGGHIERLRQSQAEARQRCLEAYPVCRACGVGLPQADVARGINRHERCDTPEKVHPGEER